MGGRGAELMLAIEGLDCSADAVLASEGHGEGGLDHRLFTAKPDCDAAWATPQVGCVLGALIEATFAQEGECLNRLRLERLHSPVHGISLPNAGTWRDPAHRSAEYTVLWQRMAVVDLPEHEARYIREYVNSQSHADDQAGLVQKIGSRRMLGRVHDMYDVHCEKTRWWVITHPTNLYLQTDFPEVEQALIFHLGLDVFMAERSRTEIDEDHEEHVSGSWRRFRQAVATMDSAGEAEDFQSVGIKCRDALIALAKDHAGDEWVGEVAEPPKAADFKGWSTIFAERLSDGRVRSYLKALAEKTWDLTVWLQHNSNATPDDADVVLEATANVLTAFGRLLRRREQGEPERCRRCGSYRLDEDLEVVDEPEAGAYSSTVCGGCGWRSDREFTSWVDHFEGTDGVGYLMRPPDDPPDRLHRAERAAEEAVRSKRPSLNGTA